MTRTFIQTAEFERNWERLGFTDNELRRLEWQILKDPKVEASLEKQKGVWI